MRGAAPGQATARRRRRGWLLLGLLVLVAALWAPVSRHVRAASLLLRFEGAQEGAAGWVAGLGRHAVGRSDVELATPEGLVRGRRYRPEGAPDAPGLLLVHGVHFRGMREPRLVRFAEVLASAGLDVLTPQVPSLAGLRVEPRATRRIGASASAFAQELNARSVGVMGISFAGGLALVAAADPELGGRIGYVVAVGAHHDLARVAHWYAGGVAADPSGEPASVSPHPYGAGVVIHQHVESFFPPEDVPRAREALRRLLHERWKEARALVPELSPRGAERLEAILAREERPELRARLREVIEREIAAFRQVSPAGKVGGLDVPVFLVHGSADPVIPPTETAWLAREIPDARVEQMVITPFLRHAESRSDPSFGDRWELVRFMAEVLGTAR
ncbi:MAG: CocE/NonD family hydrolase [Myxococcota bacterium]